MKFASFVFSILICFLSTPLVAQETYRFYSGVRSLGMGGVYTGTTNDETSILQQPAGLGKVRDTTFTVIDPELSGSFNDTSIAKLDNATTVMSAQGLLDALNKSKGTHWNAKLQLFPSIVGTNFGFGLHVKDQYNAEVDSTGKTYRLDYTSDYAVALGYCFRFFGGIIKLGTSARLVDRTEVHKNLDATSTTLDLGSLESEGFGVVSDVGLILTLPIELLPALSAVVHDAGTTSYSLSGGYVHNVSTRPNDTPQTIDAGLSIFPILGNNSRMAVSFDMYDVTNVQQTQDPLRRYHAGFEFNVHDFFFLRGGLNDGRYWTAGIELATERFQIQLASYGEEIGIWPATLEDRRWVTKFTFRF